MFSRTLAGEIAKLLGFELVPQKLDSDGRVCSENFHQMVRADGLKLTVGNWSNTKPHCSWVHIQYIDALGNQCTFPYDSMTKELTKTINFSVEKGAEKIAKDIQNRLMPDAEKAYAEGQKAKKEHDEYCQTLIGQFNELVSLTTGSLAIKPLHRNEVKNYTQLDIRPEGDFSRYGYGDIRNSRGTVDLDIHSLPLGAAKVMLAAWSEWVKNKHLSERE